ncbi:hypothetical protein Q5752_000312 [Cryptotrichosporon argae]
MDPRLPPPPWPADAQPRPRRPHPSFARAHPPPAPSVPARSRYLPQPMPMPETVEPRRRRTRDAVPPATVPIPREPRHIRAPSPPRKPSPDLRTGAAQTLDTILDALACPICMSTLVAPLALVPCGHTLCGPCTAEWFRTKAEEASPITCPTCRAPVDTRHPTHADRLAESTIDALLAARPDAEWAERIEAWAVQTRFNPNVVEESMGAPPVGRLRELGIDSPHAAPAGLIADLLGHNALSFDAGDALPPLARVVRDLRRLRVRHVPGSLLMSAPEDAMYEAMVGIRRMIPRIRDPLQHSPKALSQTATTNTPSSTRHLSATTILIKLDA